MYLSKGILEARINPLKKIPTGREDEINKYRKILELH